MLWGTACPLSVRASMHWSAACILKARAETVGETWKDLLRQWQICRPLIANGRGTKIMLKMLIGDLWEDFLFKSRKGDFLDAAHSCDLQTRCKSTRQLLLDIGRRDPVGFGFFFNCVDSWHSTQVVRIYGKYFYLLILSPVPSFGYSWNEISRSSVKLKVFYQFPTEVN